MRQPRFERGTFGSGGQFPVAKPSTLSTNRDG